MRYIKDFNIGDKIEDIYFVESTEIRTKSDGSDFLRVYLRDKTGKIQGNAWEIKKIENEHISAGDYILVTGEIVTYSGNNQVKIYGLKKQPQENINFSDYMEISKYDLDEMAATIGKIIDKVENRSLKELLESIFIQDAEFMNKFKRHPAAKTIHHNYVGGLIEHTIGVARICNAIAGLYENINKDLLLTGALLHDIGKVSEMTEYPLIEYTDQGQFLGHIVTCINIIHDHVKQIEGFPEILEIELEHLILSHHGEYEFGSPKKPALLEAFILSHADNMDAKIEVFRKELNLAGDNEWTKKIYSLDTPIRKTEVTE